MLNKKQGASLIIVIVVFIALISFMLLVFTLFNNNFSSIDNFTEYHESDLLATSAIKIGKASLFANNSRLYKDFKKLSGNTIKLEETLDKTVFDNLPDNTNVKLSLKKIDDSSSENHNMIEITAEVQVDGKTEYTKRYYVDTDKTKDDHYE